MLLLRSLLKCLLLLLFAGVSHAQTTILRPDGFALSTVWIDQKVKQLMDTAGVTGLALAILQNDQPAYLKAYGFRNREKKWLNDSSTIFYAASFSKAVFAYLVMQLVDENRIDLDKPLAYYLPKPLPEYEGFENLSADDRWKQLTARHCLSHTTGFPNWRWANPNGTEKLEFFFDPGARYAYSGEGIQLLQRVVETVMGEGLESLMQQRVFKPLGMKRSSYVWRLAFEKNYAIPYNEDEKALPRDKRSKPYAAGSMETCIADYARFAAAILQGKGLSEQSRREMITPQIPIYSAHQFPSLDTATTSAYRSIELSYGLGWGLFNGNYGWSFFKEGHGEGWENYQISFPDKKFALVIMTNSSNGESIFRDIVTTLAGEASIPWDWEGYLPYRGHVRLPEAALKPLTGEYQFEGIKALVTLEEGALMVECKQEGLPKTRLYAASDSVFYIRSFDLQMVFVKNAAGKVERLKVDDEGRRYEMKKTR